MHLTRRAFLESVGAATIGLVAAACGSLPQGPMGSANATQPAARSAGLTALVTNSELVLGRNRFTMALLDAQNRPVSDAVVSLEFFQVAGSQATKHSDAKATFRSVDQPNRGVYSAPASFPTAGEWGVQVSAQQPGQQAQQMRVGFNVLAQGSAPAIGSAAIKSANPIAPEVSDPAQLCTQVPPCDLHALRIKDVVGTGKPASIVFATPGFCSSQTCAPQLGVVLKLRDRLREQASFVHIEIYKDPQNRVVADTVTEWKLPSEPWIYMVDKSGVISDRFEGAASLEELEASLRALL